MNETVLQAIEAHALTPEAIEPVIALTERDDCTSAGAALTERRDLDKRIAKLVSAIEVAGDITSLATKLRELESRRAAIDADLRVAQPCLAWRQRCWKIGWRSGVGSCELDDSGSRRDSACVPWAHHLPPRDGWRRLHFMADTRFDKLFAGVCVERPAFIPSGNAGTEHIGSDDLIDADYGQLLEAALTGLGVCARQVSNLRPPA